MLKTLTRPIRYIHSIVREKKKSNKRSSKWDEVRDEVVQSHPTCAACGSTKKLQVHHIEPFHLHPELELDVKNLIVLCMDVNECHLEIGHGGSFRCYNPRVVAQAQRYLMEKSDIVKKSILEVCKMTREKN
jgi:hypothetical protein